MQRYKLPTTKKRKYIIEESENDTGYDSRTVFLEDSFPLSAKRVKLQKNRNLKMKRTACSTDTFENEHSKYQKEFKSPNHRNIVHSLSSPNNSDLEVQTQLFSNSPLTSILSPDCGGSIKTTKKNMKNERKFLKKGPQSLIIKESHRRDGYTTDLSDLKVLDDVDFMINTIRSGGTPRKKVAKTKFNNKQKLEHESKNTFLIYLEDDKQDTEAPPKSISLEQKITIGASIVSACVGFVMKYSEVFSNAK